MKKKLLLFISVMCVLNFINAQNYKITKIDEKSFAKSIQIERLEIKDNKILITLSFLSSDWSYLNNCVSNKMQFGPPEKLKKVSRHTFLPRTQEDTVYLLLLEINNGIIDYVLDLICDCDTCFKFKGIHIEETNDIVNISRLNKGIPSLVNKGKIMLNDGTSYSFKQLHVVNDTVEFTNSKSKICKYKVDDVYKITEVTGNNASKLAISYGLGGLLGGIAGTFSWDSSLGDFKMPFIAGATILCAVIGGAIGATKKKEITIYKNSASLSFYPSMNIDYDNRFIPMFTLNLKF